MKIMDHMSIWEPVEIPVGRCVSWRLGKLSVWVERYEKEWHVLPVYAEEAGAVPEFIVRNKADKPVSSDWRHFLLREGSWVSPSPAMPDRPVILRPDRVLVLLPGEKAQFFVSLPVALRLSVGRTAGGRKKRLCEHPIMPLANAWFGDPVSGELCYFAAARLYHEYDQVPRSPFHAVCPLKISNESERELQFDRICLHTEFLGVYRGPDRYWTNEVSVLFRGPEQVTQILPSKSAPFFEGAAKLVTEPRQAVENWYFKRTFDLLKYFTGF
jgi:hypothetical protein